MPWRIILSLLEVLSEKMGQQAEGFKQRAFSNFEGDFASILEEEERWEDLIGFPLQAR